jgi:hypothetical protein
MGKIKDKKSVIKKALKERVPFSLDVPKIYNLGDCIRNLEDIKEKFIGNCKSADIHYNCMDDELSIGEGRKKSNLLTGYIDSGESPYCCGLYEFTVQHIHLSGGFNYLSSAEEQGKLIRFYMFLTMLHRIRDYGIAGYEDDFRCFMYNTTNESYLEKAFSKVLDDTGIFVNVHSWRNPGTGNTITCKMLKTG